jgi:transcriptional regulator with XRE-family HTH domain
MTNRATPEEINLLPSPSMMTTTIGRRIRDARLAKGWTQKDLARACGWRQQSRVSHYERGTREPDSGDLSLLASVLDTTPAWLAFEDGVGGATGKRAPLDTEIEKLVRAMPVPANDRAALLRLLSAWVAMPPLFREYIAKKTAELRSYTDRLPPVVQMSLKSLPTGAEYERFEQSLQQEVKEHSDSGTSRQRRLPKPDTRPQFARRQPNQRKESK